MESFSEFIEKHENDDTAALLLSGKIPAGIDPGLAANTIGVRRKLKKKVPSWHARPELAYPLKLSGEQCSSEATATYKAELLGTLFRNDGLTAGTDGPESRKPAVADLTGGLGVDSWAFSKVAGKVLYNEMNPALADAARKNFKILGCGNIIVKSCMIVPSLENEDGSSSPDSPDRHHEAEEMTPGELLGNFKPDIIFMDPARRSADGSKVFLLEHCSPDVLSLRDELFSLSRYIMLKVSPMADISMLMKRLGESVRHLHILAAGGECKEILVLMDREFHGPCSIVAANHVGRTGGGAPSGTVQKISAKGWAGMEFSPADMEANARGNIRFPESVSAGDILYEPGKALMKAGVFNVLCERYPLGKLGKSTHYYILDAVASENERVFRELADFGKFFDITEALPLDKRHIKETGKKYPQAEVTARNIKMDTDTLRKKLGVSSGGNVHIFGLGCDFPSRHENLLLVCKETLSGC